MSAGNGIAYQNKDIASKYLEENLKNKTFAVYGIDVPKIVEVLPTNLPIIEANELRMDNLFLLEDGSVALVDYESDYADEDKIKYLNYIIRTLKRIMSRNHQFVQVRMIVIYTADIERKQTRARLDIGCLQFQLEEAFLTELDSVKIEAEIQKKITRGEALTEEEQMQFIILPLTYKGKYEKQKCVRRCFDMAKSIEDAKEQVFLLSGMLVFADKVITGKDSKEVKNWIMMTQVGRLFEEEKLEYARQQVKEKETELAKKMLDSGDSLEKVAGIVTILSREELIGLTQQENEKQ